MILTFIVAVLNLCLGYAVAVRMGYAPPSLRNAWDVIPGFSAEPTEFDVAPEQLLEELAAAPLEDMFDDEPDDMMDDDMEVESYEDEEEDDATEQLEVQGTEAWELDEKYIETSLIKLNIAMIKSGKRATDIDTRLRTCQGNSDAETIQQCLAELKEDCESYLTEHGELAEKFSERIGELGELTALGDDIEMANLEQSAQVETTLNNLTHMDFDTDLEQANARLLEEIGNLRVARHKMHDNQDAAFMAIARQENRVDAIDARMFSDPLTRLYNRIGLETTLCKWWQEKRHQTRQINAALFDIDAMGLANEKYGALTGDRILHHLAQLIQEQVGKTDLLGRFSGQRFLLVMLDVGPRAALKTAETIRQLIEQAVFVIGDEEESQTEIRVSIGSGIAEVSPEETMDGFIGRLEQALGQAKTTGPNQAFSHNGKEVEPAHSPSFGVGETRIKISF